MKTRIAALLGSALLLATPAFAAEYDMHHSAMNHSGVSAGGLIPVRDIEGRDSQARVGHSWQEHVSYHVDRRHPYHRTYRNDRVEHAATEDLNRQYRGVER